jgi:hypothetical protein
MVSKTPFPLDLNDLEVLKHVMVLPSGATVRNYKFLLYQNLFANCAITPHFFAWLQFQLLTYLQSLACSF